MHLNASHRSLAQEACLVKSLRRLNRNGSDVSNNQRKITIGQQLIVTNSGSRENTDML